MKPKKQLSQTDIKNINKLYDEQKSSAQIADELGLPLELVLEYILYLDDHPAPPQPKTKVSPNIKETPNTSVNEPISADEILDLERMSPEEMWKAFNDSKKKK